MNKPVWKCEWNETMSVGIPEIDKEHKHFIFLVKRFNEAVADRMPMIEVKKRLQEIIDDTGKHFSHEEKLFNEWQYPDIAGHADIHSKIIKELQDIRTNSIPYGFDTEWIEAGMKIKQVLIDHILNEDKKYADFFSNSRNSVTKN